MTRDAFAEKAKGTLLYWGYRFTARLGIMLTGAGSLVLKLSTILSRKLAEHNEAIEKEME